MINYRKNLFILCWTIFSSFIIWVMNFINFTEYNIESFVWFAMMFLIAGFSFNFLTEMIRTPITTENENAWNNLGKNLIQCSFIIVAVVGIGYFEKQVYSLGGLLTFLAILIGTISLSKATNEARNVFREINQR